MTATWLSALRLVLAAAVVSLSGAALGLHSAHAATLAEIKARGYMIVATEDDYKPFEFMENGKPVGFDNFVELGSDGTLLRSLRRAAESS